MAGSRRRSREAGLSVQPKTVVIALLPDRVDVAVRRGGRTLGGKRILIDLDSDPRDWLKTIESSVPALAAVVDELGIDGAPTVVVYRSPTQSVELVSLPLRSPTQAREAARLSGTESLPYSSSDALCEALVVGRDSGRDEPQTHAVVAAERDDIAGAIVALVESAGLTFVSATPTDAVLLARIVKAALREKSADRGWLYIGETSSFFVVTSKGMLRVRRCINIGLQTIANSLTRPIRSTGQGDPIELTADVAREILHGSGLNTDRITHGQFELSREQIMPLMQPVLQRYIVELRQSLRFGLSDEQRRRVSISVMGPGSAIPGLVDLIARELGVQTTIDPNQVEYDYRVPGSEGSELVDATTDRGLLGRLNLQSKGSADRRRLGRLRRWLWTGAAAAIAMVALDGYRYHVRLDEARQEADTLTRHVTRIQEIEDARVRLVEAMDAMTRLQQTVVDEIGGHADLSALMQELTHLTPESVRLTALSFRHDGDTTQGQLTGYAFATDAAGTDQLEDFIEALKSSPLIEDVVLDKVNIGALHGRSGRRFDAHLVAISVPGKTLETELATAGESGP